MLLQIFFTLNKIILKNCYCFKSSMTSKTLLHEYNIDLLLLFLVLQNSCSVQSLSHVQLFVTPWTAACQASLSISNPQSLLKLMSIKSVMPSNHLILCHPFLLLPSIFPSIRIFSNESVLHIRWPKYWSYSFSISPSNEYSGLIFFRMEWLDLLAVQGMLKSLLQHHSSKASMFECLLRRYGSAVVCYRSRGSGCSRPGYGISPFGGGHD